MARPLYKYQSQTNKMATFLSAPPLAIEISTPWKIIVRVSPTSDLR